jgi:hypothetical protein
MLKSPVRKQREMKTKLGWDRKYHKFGSITPISSPQHRAHQRQDSDPYNAASRLVEYVHWLTTWNVASKCGCKSAQSFLVNHICRSRHIIPTGLAHLDPVLTGR